MRKFILLSTLLTSFFPFVSACDLDGHVEETIGNNLTNFSLFSGSFYPVIQVLVIIVLGLLIYLLIKKSNGGKK